MDISRSGKYIATKVFRLQNFTTGKFHTTDWSRIHKFPDRELNLLNQNPPEPMESEQTVSKSGWITVVSLGPWNASLIWSARPLSKARTPS